MSRAEKIVEYDNEGIEESEAGKNTFLIHLFDASACMLSKAPEPQHAVLVRHFEDASLFGCMKPHSENVQSRDLPARCLAAQGF